VLVAVVVLQLRGRILCHEAYFALRPAIFAEQPHVLGIPCCWYARLLQVQPVEASVDTAILAARRCPCELDDRAQEHALGT
jgi:hypothetical protein